jgi:hypothetical protein
MGRQRSAQLPGAGQGETHRAMRGKLLQGLAPWRQTLKKPPSAERPGLPIWRLILKSPQQQWSTYAQVWIATAVSLDLL